MKERIGLTMGDPAGIGPEIILKSWSRLSKQERDSIVIIGSRFVLKKASSPKGLREVNIKDIDNIKKKGFKFGALSKVSGKASIEYLNVAMRMLKEKNLSALVTCPISKFAIDLVHRGFRGQTEYLAKLDKAKQVRMMLTSSRLKFSLVTTHIPLRNACRSLTSDGIFNTIVLTASELKQLFNVKIPSIGVCALNPHLGENGLLGTEEKDIISPAISQAQKLLSKVRVYGPLPLEKIVFDLKKGVLDVGVCLYHDQAILPLKLFSPRRGVNLTLGLSFVRTSPLHGTAFDIAGTNKADPASLLEAIRLARKLISRRRTGNYKESTEK